MKELEDMKKSFDEFMAKAEQTLVRMKGTAPKEILDKEEKEYLENLLRPFRDRVSSICKHKWDNSREYIKIYMKFNETIRLPLFTKNTMYKNMKVDKEYTLEELGLFKE